MSDGWTFLVSCPDPPDESPVLCQELGCTKEASEYVVTYAADDPSAHFMFCADHAAAAGFCTICGEFYGGTEEFFHSGIRGVCCECIHSDEFDPDNWDDEDDEP